MNKSTTNCKAVLRRDANLFAALGDETRLQLLVKLGAGAPQSIRQLSKELPVTRQAVTKRLRVLEGVKFVTQEIHGRERRFTVNHTRIEDAQAALKVISQQWDDALVSKAVQTAPLALDAPVRGR